MKLTANGKVLNLNSPVIMGILNATPDSFSDGGQFNRSESAFTHAMDMINAGAKIIDIGGESTRPGAEIVSTASELERVIPVITAIRAQSDVWISLDSSNPVVMQAAIDAGVDLLNDVRSFQQRGALEVAANSGLPLCIMHMQGQPKTMQDNPEYSSVCDEVLAWLAQRKIEMLEAGVNPSNIIYDPGFGFGKTMHHNFDLLAQTEKILSQKQPVLIGLSRKTMFGQLLGLEAPKARKNASVVAAFYAAQQGAHILRVHDVAETFQALSILSAVSSNHKS
jgi:dihydropteroate synthase